MPRSIDHRQKKFEVYLARKNIMRENLDLRKQLVEVEWIIAQRYEVLFRAKDDEIARLMTIIRREQEARRQLDLYLQKWVLENPEVKDEAQSEN